MTLGDLADFLEQRLPIAGERDVPTLWRGAADDNRSVRRLGLALDPPPRDAVFADLDALFLHRPFRLEPDGARNPPVLAAHAAFDAHLTTAFNAPLAAALKLGNVHPVLRPGDGIVIGMAGEVTPAVSWSALRARVAETFDGLDQSLAHGTHIVARVAVMSAINADLVAQAVATGVNVYVTGQLRVPGLAPAARAGLGVIAVGHRRSETWGLQQLACELRVAFPGLEAVLLGTGSP